jgi:hypothetical protein
MTDLPTPLTPTDCDLRGLEYMPLLGQHLFGSEFNARADDSEWRAGVTLWWAAWCQVPAASLPDDDIALCRFADLGRDVKVWKRLRANALHGWVKCSDGRLYHPLLAKQALIAWDKRQVGRIERSSSAERKARERAERSRMFEQLSAVGVTPEWNAKTSDLRNLVTTHCHDLSRPNVTPVTPPVTDNVTAKTRRDETRRKEEDSVPDGTADLAKKPDDENPPAIDPAKAFFDEAVAYLGGKHRTLIARWTRDHGVPACTAALRTARAENGGKGPDEPVPFMIRVLSNGAEREAARREAERKADADFDRRFPDVPRDPDEMRAILGPDEFPRWQARQAAKGRSAAA